MSSLRISAPAKINLVLRILGRREDGYHELDTLFQAVSLSDEVVLTEQRRPGVELVVAGADVGPTEDNLALRAARAWQAESGIEPAVEIRLTKRIPAGAGLGGGSSDAGAVLRGLEVMYGHPLGTRRLQAIGAGLGADVPFFCGTSGLARGRGIGEELSPVAELPPRRLLIVVPGVPVSTPSAYGWVAATREAGAPVSAPLDLPPSPSWTELDGVAGNDFHAVVASRVEEVAAAARAMEEAGLSGVLLSGSGGAIFGFLPDAGAESYLEAVERRTALLGCRSFLVETLPHLPGPEPRATQA